jgi:hypothetical protein
MTIGRTGVVFGLLTDWSLSFVLKIAILSVLWVAHISFNPIIVVVSFTSALTALAVGGYVATRVSRSRAVSAAVAVGVIDMVLSLVSWALKPAAWNGSLWLSILYIAAMVPAAWAGGLLALRRHPIAPESDDESEASREPSA